VEWTNISMWSYKVFFLQVQPNFISHLKLVWHPMLIMEFLVLGIELLQSMINLLEYVLYSFNEPGGFFGFGLCME
jgi:hypothetical protein